MWPWCSGIIGERLPIRLYLSAGMLASGLFTCLFGLGYIYNVHSLRFYISVQVGLVTGLRYRSAGVLIAAPLPVSRCSTVWSKPPAGPVSSPASATGLGKDGRDETGVFERSPTPGPGSGTGSWVNWYRPHIKNKLALLCFINYLKPNDVLF